MQNVFFGKNIVVTGASSGIGQAESFFFLNCGANVLLAGRDEKTLKTMTNKFKNARVAKFDIGKDMSLFDFKTTIVELLGKVDILVNCAGTLLDGDVEKTYPQDFDFIVNINLRSVFLLLKLLEKYFVEGASIINISCLYGTKPMVGMISYAMSKAGLETLTRYAAADFASLRIRINAITACPVDTNNMRLIKVEEEEINNFKEKMEKNIPLGRIARPDDIVKVIAFLASNRSEKITGQIIKVDGGRSLTSSGYVHYKGMLNMNSRFEPDGLSIKSWFKDKLTIKGKMEREIKDKNELRKFVEENINKSNFSTRLADAHLNINPNYKIVDSNEDMLKSTFLKGKTPNELLDIKSSKQNKMTYNEGQFPVQIAELKNSLFANQRYSKNTVKENFDSNNNYDEYGIKKINDDNVNNVNNIVNYINQSNMNMPEKNDNE